jgi:hypothetical protein
MVKKIDFIVTFVFFSMGASAPSSYNIASPLVKREKEKRIRMQSLQSSLGR